MSGGHFDYIQHRYGEFIEEIERILNKNGVELSKKELQERYPWRESEWYDKYPEDKKEFNYSEETIAQFKEGLKYIKLSQIYLNRIDYLICGDDSEKSFHERLKEDIEKQNL